MICLTFDTDWMTEADLAQFLEQFPIPGAGTYFVHRRFECLAGLQHEVCPHPFIENLSEWETGMQTLAASLGRPAAGVRTHSCVFSHMIGVSLHRLGYRYISQAQNLFEMGLKPFRHPWGIWELPIYYMDNMDFWMAVNWPDTGHRPFSPEVIRRAITGESLFVFDIHPLHVALNTRAPTDYTAVKDKIVREGVSPFELTYPGRGVRAFFEELCSAMREAAVTSATCTEALSGQIALA